MLLIMLYLKCPEKWFQEIQVTYILGANSTYIFGAMHEFSTIQSSEDNLFLLKANKCKLVGF